ncbi:4751_t:CDS:2, partial [Dentiscutata erythropus]
TLVEDDGGQRKGRNKDKPERLLDRETLSHACEKWKKKVDEFWKTITKAKKPTEKEPDENEIEVERNKPKASEYHGTDSAEVDDTAIERIYEKTERPGM